MPELCIWVRARDALSLVHREARPPLSDGERLVLPRTRRSMGSLRLNIPVKDYLLDTRLGSPSRKTFDVARLHSCVLRRLPLVAWVSETLMRRRSHGNCNIGIIAETRTIKSATVSMRTMRGTLMCSNFHQRSGLNLVVVFSASNSA